MAGTLIIDEMTKNTISVTWNVSISAIASSTTPLTSITFPLFTDGTLILFSLTMDYQSGFQGYKVIIKHHLNIPTRAIITLSLDIPQVPVILRTELVEYWPDTYEFVYPSLSPQSIVDYAATRSPGTCHTSSIIKCDITWLGNFSPIPKTPHFPKELCLPSIPYNNELKPDVKLIMGDEELSAHKNVLALHSPVFLGMFDAPMKESKENRVVIEDVDFSTMEILLKIIYSGETEELDDLDIALKVLSATEKYQMLTVQKACEYKLQLKVGKANVVKLLEEGDKFNAANLLQLCIEYIIAARDIISPKDLEKMCLKRPNLSAAVIATQMKRLCSIPSNNIRDYVR